MVTQIAPSPPEIFGLKVSNISSAIGWGAQGGTCSLTLVDEGEPASYGASVDESSPTGFTAGFRRQPPPRTGTGTPAVQGFPPAGTACGFNFRAFSFGGIIQRWTYKESLSGRLYDLILESPAKLLDGAQVITGAFEAGYAVDGTTNILKYEVKNVWNAFALFENYAFGGFIGGNRGKFGGSQSNDGGIPVDKLFLALKTFGSNGTIANSGTAPIFGGKLRFGESEYTIGFSELEAIVLARAPYYRVKGPIANLNSIISDLCETVQVDYFIQLVAPNNGVIENPHLEVRIADKSQVSSGVVQQYVNSFTGQGIVIATNYGEELQSSPTGKVLIGGPASRVLLKSVKGSTTTRAVWDQLGDSSFVIGDTMKKAYGSLHAKVPITLSTPSMMPPKFRGRLGGQSLVESTEYTATLFELRLALASNQVSAFENWKRFKGFQIGTSNEPNGFTYDNAYGMMSVNPAKVWQAHIGAMGATDVFEYGPNFSKYSFTTDEFYSSSLDRIFKGVLRVAQNFYGQVFVADLPEERGGIDNNLRWIDPTFKTQYEASWEISQSAWANDKPIRDARFYDGGGKLQGYSAWNGEAFRTNIDAFGRGGIRPNIDFSAFGQDWGTDVFGFKCCMKGGPNKDIFWDGGNAYCIINSGAPVAWWDSLTTRDYGMDILSKMFFVDQSGGPMSLQRGIYIDMARGSQHYVMEVPPAYIPPDYIIIPQESTRYTWGPWYAVTDVANGSAEVEIDTTMTPETYGSVAAMDQVGFGSVFSGLARTEAIETGSVELAQEPKFNLGDRFAASGPYVTNLDIGINDGGIKTSYKFSTWTPTFGKLSKYNADRISAITKSSVQAAKNARGPNGALPKHSFPKFVQSFGAGAGAGFGNFPGIGGVGGNGGKPAPENGPDANANNNAG